jgi:hypothetical protein
VTLEDVARRTFEHALANGAPGLSEITRSAIVRGAMLRMSHQVALMQQDEAHLGFPLADGSWMITATIEGNKIPLAFSRVQAIEIARRISENLCASKSS